MWRWGVKWPEISETSFARSATLEDTSWARLTTELTRWNLPDSQLCLKSKTEQSVAKAQNYIGGRGHCTYIFGEQLSGKKHILGGGDTVHTFLMGRTIGGGGGTLHCTTLKEKAQIQHNCLVCRKLYHFAAQLAS